MEENYQQLLPIRKRIWTKKRRNIVHKVFRRELLDLNLSITQSKVQKALDEINRLEEDTMNTINFDKLRGYVYKARKNREEKMKNDEIPSPLPSDSDSDEVCENEKDAEHKANCFSHENDTGSEKANFNWRSKLEARFLKDEGLNKTVKLVVLRKKHDGLSKFDEEKALSSGMKTQQSDDDESSGEEQWRSQCRRQLINDANQSVVLSQFVDTIGLTDMALSSQPTKLWRDGYCR